MDDYVVNLSFVVFTKEKVGKQNSTICSSRVFTEVNDDYDCNKLMRNVTLGVMSQIILDM